MEHGQQLILRGSGEETPFNAGDAVAVTCDLYRLPIPGAWRARLGKAAKGLLEDGFDPNTVCAALLCSVKRARPDMAPVFAVEISQARAGQEWSWREYRAALKDARGPELSPLYAMLKEAFK